MIKVKSVFNSVSVTVGDEFPTMEDFKKAIGNEYQTMTYIDKKDGLYFYQIDGTLSGKNIEEIEEVSYGNASDIVVVYILSDELF